MNKIFKVAALLILGISILIYFGIYFITPPFLVKSDIEKYINENHNHNQKFEIVEIKIEYSYDLFHQPTGYSIILEDKNGLKFSNIFLQNNSAKGKWITYMGTDIENEYLKAKRNNTE